MKGFTLIELLLVIVIISILGAMSTIFYSRFLTQSNVSNVQDQMLGSLRKAQMYSMMCKRNSNWGVRFGTDTRKITLYSGINYDNRTPAYDENFTVASSITMTGAPIDINFTRMTGITGTTSITINGPNNTNKTININGQGVASR